ncbi:MAG: hypothetical protein GOMPHAMPRED_003218 [Gomphillus americanus]|uniref:Metallo-dependent hydrolase n=1 Tax=Gomphillus americanus TaxID=1940652 RepID=A0A8H3EK40_9LECA|nr:MAG: hypothetical protein GOMPHAMPRED_003218 [Gomphillus americanus]
MAAEFLALHGVNLGDEVSLAYNSTLAQYDEEEETAVVTQEEVDFHPSDPLPIRQLENIIFEKTSAPQNITITEDGRIGMAISKVSKHDSIKVSETPRFVLPSLAHPHIHLDKPFLLSHNDTLHLKAQDGTFKEALDLTGKAKELYTTAALLERGAQLLADSSRAGVTHVRGFCEVDTSVGLKCIEAGLKLKAAWRRCLYVQLAAFAQDPIFSAKTRGTGANPDDDCLSGNQNLDLLLTALQEKDVDVLATTPYVETSLAASKCNIAWTINTAIEYDLHLDFHLDYNIDANQEPLVWFVLEELRRQDWNGRQTGHKTVCLGHCTRLTLFSSNEWERLAKESIGLPVYFIGLPTSDLFMQGRPEASNSAAGIAAASHNRPRATLHVPSLLNLGLKVAVGINNIGNLFTPFGSADPLRLAEWGVGIYQDGSADTARILYECVSWRAKEAIGLEDHKSTKERSDDPNVPRAGSEADLIVFGPQDSGKKFVLHRKSIAEVVWNPPPEHERLVIYQGNRVTI